MLSNNPHTQNTQSREARRARIAELRAALGQHQVVQQTAPTPIALTTPYRQTQVTLNHNEAQQLQALGNAVEMAIQPPNRNRRNIG